MAYIGAEPIVSATRTITEVTATAGQTVFVANGGYTVGYIDVFLNGAQLQTVDFTATNGSSITLTEAAQAGDVIRLVAWGTFQTSSALTANNPSYTGTLTGGTDVVNIGSGQIYKDSSGNVGIGTSSPSQPLTVKTNSSSNIAVRILNSSGGKGAIQFTDDPVATGQAAIESGTGSYLAFQTNGGTERMRLDSSGNLLVGTTSGTARLRINKGSGDGFWMMQGFTDGSEQLRINNSGSIQNALSSYGALSDIKLKKDITDASPKLDDLCNVRIVNFVRVDDASETKQIGVIAQELEQIFPSLIDESPDFDEQGNPLGTTTKGVKYSVFVPMLIKAIQEQQEIITDLKARIETLENK